jgi:hypothetical protein
MNLNLLRKLAVFGVVLCVSPACQKSNPARASIVTPSVNGAAEPVFSTLTRLSGSYVGMANELCEGGAAVAIDDLTVDYQVSGVSLAGALLVACDTDNCQGSSPLGTISVCPLPPNPCEAGLPQAASEGTTACLTGDPSGTGSLRVYAARPADASASWHVAALFEESGDRTNTVTGFVDQVQDVVASDSSSSMDSARFARRARKLTR